MIWHAFSLLVTTGRDPSGAKALNARWSRAADREPALVRDLIELGGLMTALPHELIDGQPTRMPVDPNQVLIDQGRRELALQLLAAMKMNPGELADILRDTE